MYSEAVQRGNHLLTVDASTPKELDTAREIMERNRCVDIERTAEGWRGQGSAARTGSQEGRPTGRARTVDRR